MRSTHNKYAFGYAGIAVAIAIPVSLMAWSMISEAKMYAKESSQRALFAEAVDLLAEYHEQHGEYPDSLNQLELTYPDGGDKSTLATLTYNTDGANYVLTTKGIASGQELRECSGEAKALETAKQWVIEQGENAASSEFSVNADGKGWTVLIEYQPPTPGRHTFLRIDSQGKVIEVIPGA